MTLKNYKAPGSGNLVPFNTNLTEHVLLAEISITEMREIIAEYERARIDVYWDETTLVESEGGGCLHVFEYAFFKAEHLRTISGTELQGRTLKSHLCSLPLEEQKARALTYKPKSQSELKSVLIRPAQAIAPDFYDLLAEAGSVATFVEGIVKCLSTNDAPYLHPFRYFELLTVLWAKGLLLFPFGVTAWPTPIKWSTLTNARYGGPRSALIKSVYTLPPRQRTAPALAIVCTFFAVSDTASAHDLCPTLIRDYEEIANGLMAERYPREKGVKAFYSQRGRVRFVAMALLQCFNAENPKHAIEITRPVREGVVDEERRVDGQFRWLATARPDLAIWADMFRAHVAALKTIRIGPQVDRLNMLGDFICSIAEPPSTPWRIIRSIHIYDATLRHENTFLGYINNHVGPVKRKNEILYTVRRFFDWLHDYLVANGSADAESFKNPVFFSDSTGRNAPPSRTARDSLPPYVMKELREIIIENDFEFSKRYKRSTVQVRDSLTGNNTWIFYPGMAVCLYTLFDTPIRSHQARWLDAGVLDERIYDLERNSEIPNPSKYAIRGRREGVLRLERDGLRANAWLTMWVNTNKTAEYNSAKIGYLIPYVSETLAHLLQTTIDWQKRYLPDMHAPVAYISYQKDVREAPRPARVKGPQIVPLFRDPSSPDRVHPISYARLRRFYIHVLAEAQTRIARKYGQKLQLVEDNGKGGLKWSVDLHTLRVSGITNLIEAGVPLEVVQQFVAGHATLVMTLHYLRYSPAKLRKFLEMAYERMLNDEDFVGSEAFAEYLDEFSPFLLGQEGAGVGAGFRALQEKTGIMTITSEGICPGTSCSTGGLVESAAQNKFGPVPGGQRCGLCRYWLTGPAHLLGQVAAVNNLAYTIRRKGQEVASLNDQRIDAEDNGNQRKARELRDRVDILNRELEIDINEWAARYQYAEKSVALMDAYLSTKEKVKGTGAAVPVPILTASSALELKVTLEAAHEFALLDQITQMSEFTTGFNNREAELEKNTILSKMMVANGMPPFLLSLNEQQAHEAGNLLSAMLLQQVRGHELDEVLVGRKPLSSYPRLAGAIKRLEERVTPELLEKGQDISEFAESLDAVDGNDVEGEEVFG